VSEAGTILKRLVAFLALFALLAFSLPLEAHAHADRVGQFFASDNASVAVCSEDVAGRPHTECCLTGCCGLACCPSLVLPPASTREAFWRPFTPSLAGHRLHASVAPDVAPPPPKTPIAKEIVRVAATSRSESSNLLQWRIFMHRLKSIVLVTTICFAPWSAAQAQDATMPEHGMEAPMPDACMQESPAGGHDMAAPSGTMPAAEIEAAVIDQLRGIFRQPEIIVGTWRAARAEQDDITEDEVRDALTQLDPLWDELFPAEQARIVHLLVERVDVRIHGVEVRLRPNGLAGLVREVAGNRRAAA
jgi:hypothetical protein